MRWVFVLLTVVGMVVSSLALREHYRSEDESSPCKINEKWDCGTVNHSRYATLGLKFNEKLSVNIPVATLGIGAYLFLGVIAFSRKWLALFTAAVPSLMFSLYLTNIEQNILEVWCLYCVASQIIMATLTLLATITALVAHFRPARATAP